MTKIIYILTLLLLVACQSRKKQQQENFESQYLVKSYYSNDDDPKNLSIVKYYDSSDKLIREIGKEGDCIRYIYDEAGKLKEKVWGRSCEQVQGVVRSIIRHVTRWLIWAQFITNRHSFMTMKIGW
jgi:YD repeat-containing protein